MIRAEAHPRQQHDARIAGQTEQQLRRLGVFEQPVDELAAIRALAELLHVDDRVLRRARVREQITLSGSPPRVPDASGALEKHAAAQIALDGLRR